MALKQVKPNEFLMRELVELADVAAQLRVNLLNSNKLPPEFPTNQIVSYCHVVESLKHGTEEGCREPLLFISRDLGRLRRLHILDKKSAETLEKTGDDDCLPPLMRGETEDQHIVNLLAAINTSLDEYREQASVIDEEPIVFTKEPSVKTFSELVAAISSVSIRVNDIDDKLKAVKSDLNESDDSAQNFIRTVSDARTTIDLTRTAFSLPSIVPIWTSRLVAKVKKYPVLISKVGYAMRMTAAVGKPLADSWIKMKTEFSDYFFEQVDQAGRALDKAAKNIEELRLENSQAENFSKKNTFSQNREIFDKWIGEIFLEVCGGQGVVSYRQIESEIQKTYKIEMSKFAEDYFGEDKVKSLFDLVSTEYEVLTIHDRVYIVNLSAEQWLLTREQHRNKAIEDIAQILQGRKSVFFKDLSLKLLNMNPEGYVLGFKSETKLLSFLRGYRGCRVRKSGKKHRVYLTG